MNEVSANEFDAICLSMDEGGLRKRLNDARRALRPELRKMFRPGVFKRIEKALYSDNPFGYRLKWQTRPDPEKPESYENQQTSTGFIRLTELKRPAS